MHLVRSAWQERILFLTLGIIIGEYMGLPWSLITSSAPTTGVYRADMGELTAGNVSSGVASSVLAPTSTSSGRMPSESKGSDAVKVEAVTIGLNEVAVMNTPLVDDLLNSGEFQRNGDKLEWIKQHINRMNATWHSVFKYIQEKHPALLFRPQRILLFPGLLCEKSPFDFAGMAFKGGYLGELVQWGDLFAVLHTLGHKLTIETKLKGLISRQSEILRVKFDIIFTDYIGMQEMRLRGMLKPEIKCRIRVIDSFGTEPRAVFKTTSGKLAVQSHLRNYNLPSYKQYWTLYPHSPDNSFLGHVGNLPEISGAPPRRLNQAVVYGKEGKFFTGNEAYLKVVSKYFELHTTATKLNSDMFPHINHGVVAQSNLSRLLHQSKVFVGMGFPFEGPAPLEALAAGCVVLQGRFKTPLNSENTPFFRGKPTWRGLKTQHPYLSDFIGEPYVYSVDLSNLTEVEEALLAITAKNNDDFKPVMLHEFTANGFAERVGHYITNQNFCDAALTANLASSKGGTSSKLADRQRIDTAVDMDTTRETCTWFEPGNFWLEIDLTAVHPVTMVTIYLAPTLEIARKWKNVLSPLEVSLLDENHKVVASQLYAHGNSADREWRVGPGKVLARYVKIESNFSTNPKEKLQGAICDVTVVREDMPKPHYWPDVSHLETVTGGAGDSCIDVCIKKKMTCEPVYFPELNNKKALETSFTCDTYDKATSLTMSLMQVSALPGLKDKSCLTNADRGLIGCSGAHPDIRRICPCRKYQRGQVALPPSGS